MAAEPDIRRREFAVMQRHVACCASCVCMKTKSDDPSYAVSMSTSEIDPNVPTPPKGEFWSDEPEMETVQHLMTQLSLIATLRWLWRDRTDYFVGGNLTVYYSELRRKSEDFRGPDFFVALDVDGTKPRRSWVVWEEGGRYPDVIVELLSDTTEANDRGEKMQIYGQLFRTPAYFLFDPHTFELEGYQLLQGHYEPIKPNSHGHLPCEPLRLAFGVREN